MSVFCLFALLVAVGGLILITAIETYEVAPQFFLRAQRGPAGPAEPRPDWSEPVVVDGLELTVRPEAQEFWAYEKLSFAVTLKNVSEQAFRLADLDTSWVRPRLEAVNTATQARWQLDVAVPAVYPPAPQGQLLQPGEAATWYLVLDRRVPPGTRVPPTPVREGNIVKYYQSHIALRRAVPPCGVGPHEFSVRLEFIAEVSKTNGPPTWAGRIASPPLHCTLWRDQEERTASSCAPVEAVTAAS